MSSNISFQHCCSASVFSCKMKFVTAMLFSVLCLVAVKATADLSWMEKEYDAIVVGAGPAGIIVAYRLARANYTTLLLEAGGPSYGVTGGDLDLRRPSWLKGTNLTRVDVPGLYKSIFADSGGLTCGASMNAYGGCTIGGNSAINAGLFLEPPSSDFDLYFPEGWKSTDMRQAIQRLYAMQPSTNITSQNGQRYLQTGYDAARKWLVEGLGFTERDINREKDLKTEAFGHPIYDYINGQRGGPVVTYLQEALKLPNFSLQSGVTVARVQRNLANATGVVVLINGTEHVISLSANGRVILSAGAIQSPSLLMFSGIGDPSVLTRLSGGRLGGLAGSQWINTTTVGAGLFDNPNTFIELQSESLLSYVYSYDNPPPHDRDLYLQHRDGPYTFASQTSVFWDTLTHSDDTTVSFQGTIDSSGYGNYTDFDTITLNVYGTSGLVSRGQVLLDDNFIPGPSAGIYYNSSQDAFDIASFIYKIFQGLPAAGLTPLNIAQNSTIDEIVTYITTPSPYKGEVNHWSSSCLIGECVDEYTRVKGMHNLHVVDSSIVPPLTVNPQFGIMAVAERASELILEL